MKLLTIRAQSEYHPAVLIDDEVLDLALARDVMAEAEGIPWTMIGLLQMGDANLPLVEQLIETVKDEARAESLRAAGALLKFAEVTLGPVVPDPELVLSGSMNSRGHLAEMGDELPVHPCAFHKVRSALSASGSEILRPPGHGDMIDWEGELSLVIGKRCHQVSVDEALDHVVGYTLMNDVSAREYALPFIKSTGPAPTAMAWERNVLGKNYPSFAPVGPFIVTKDELPSPFTYHMETLVNGEVMQSSTQDDLVFSPAEMISYFSQFYVFAPGDIISMGSPPGVGMARKPPQYLKPGDTVEVRATGLGSLVNRVSA